MPRVIIGDSSGAQLVTAFPKTELLGQEGPITGTERMENGREIDRVPITILELVRHVNGVVLSSKVKMAVIIAGRDALLQGETTDSIIEQLDRLLALTVRFGHVKTFLLPPPYVHRKKPEHTALMAQLPTLAAKHGIPFVCVTETGRSLYEVFRFGDSFNNATVNITGLLSPTGLNFVRAWLCTQVPDFVDDRAIGIVPPAVASVVVAPPPERRDRRADLCDRSHRRSRSPTRPNRHNSRIRDRVSRVRDRWH